MPLRLTWLRHDPLVSLCVGRLQPPQHLLKLFTRQPHMRPVVLLKPVLIVNLQVIFYIILLGPAEATWWAKQRAEAVLGRSLLWQGDLASGHATIAASAQHEHAQRYAWWSSFAGARPQHLSAAACRSVAIQ